MVRFIQDMVYNIQNQSRISIPLWFDSYHGSVKVTKGTGKIISIPLWFDSYCPEGNEVKLVTFLSQFHYGSIHTKVARGEEFLWYNLNSIMVRFILKPEIVKGDEYDISIPLWFDSYTFNSKETISGRWISIPLWFDSYHARRCSTQANQKISIPLWFDSYTPWNREKPFRTVHLNSIMVRFIPRKREGHQRDWEDNLNSIMVRFILVPQSLTKATSSNLNSIMVRFILNTYCYKDYFDGNLNSIMVRFIPVWMG